MRFIDIAVATLIGTSALAGLAVLSPRQNDAYSRQQLVQSELRDFMLSQIQRPGVILAIETEPQSVCQLVSTWSHPGFEFSAIINGVPCASFPPYAADVATLTIQTVPHTVVLQAWKTAGA